MWQSNLKGNKFQICFIRIKDTFHPSWRCQKENTERRIKNRFQMKYVRTESPLISHLLPNRMVAFFFSPRHYFFPSLSYFFDDDSSLISNCSNISGDVVNVLLTWFIDSIVRILNEKKINRNLSYSNLGELSAKWTNKKIEVMCRFGMENFIYWSAFNQI